MPYESRIAALSGMDAVLSATTSPHYTLTAADLHTVPNPPKVAVDLAVPRDMEPACAALLTYYDTDALGAAGVGSAEELSEIHAIVEEELARFDQWQRRSRMGESRLRFPIFLDPLRQKRGFGGRRTDCRPAHRRPEAIWLPDHRDLAYSLLPPRRPHLD